MRGRKVKTGSNAVPLTNASEQASVFVVATGNFQDGEEGFLGDVDLAYALHAAFAFFLFLEEFAFAGDVSAVAFGENVFADGGNGFARDDAAADGSLDRDFKHLARNQFAKSGDQFAAAFDGEVAVNDERERVDGFSSDKDIELNQV